MHRTNSWLSCKHLERHNSLSLDVVSLRDMARRGREIKMRNGSKGDDGNEKYWDNLSISSDGRVWMFFRCLFMWKTPKNYHEIVNKFIGNLSIHRWRGVVYKIKSYVENKWERKEKGGCILTKNQVTRNARCVISRVSFDIQLMTQFNSTH